MTSSEPDDRGARSTDENALTVQLDRARVLGFLGPGPIDEHLVHARGYLRTLDAVEGRIIDLGSGGGIPGLVLALERPDLDVVLVDATAKRCRFLEQAVTALALGERVEVVQGRAETLGRGALRGAAGAVVARSFGSPASTAECAAPLLRVGGLLVVSEPPEDAPGRWSPEGLAKLGMQAREQLIRPRLQVVLQLAACPDEFPRRDGVPAKRPLF
ncbi:MAG: class I SAM-dependent methyltransferase [Acidimicrobiales bacterium]|nr:class I SAM-dependent methyltransferase [Acidimicrobiales bacterium]